MGDLQAAELGEKHRILGSPCPELTLVWGLEWQASFRHNPLTLRISPAQYYHSQHKRKYTAMGICVYYIRRWGS